MTDHKNIIIWQKWLDPFGYDDEDDVSSFDPYVGEYNESSNDEEDDDQAKTWANAQKKAVKVIATPMGIIPMNDNTMSSKLFNFWMGHTNFDITSTVANIIEQTQGVETLDIFTRYRFRISVGKAFDDSEVMRNINNRVYEEINHA